MDVLRHLYVFLGLCHQTPYLWVNLEDLFDRGANFNFRRQFPPSFSFFFGKWLRGCIYWRLVKGRTKWGQREREERGWGWGRKENGDRTCVIIEQEWTKQHGGGDCSSKTSFSVRVSFIPPSLRLGNVISTLSAVLSSCARQRNEFLHFVIGVLGKRICFWNAEAGFWTVSWDS